MMVMVDGPVRSLMTFSLLGFQAARPPPLPGCGGKERHTAERHLRSGVRAQGSLHGGGLKDICAPPAQPWELQQLPLPLS